MNHKIFTYRLAAIGIFVIVALLGTLYVDQLAVSASTVDQSELSSDTAVDSTYYTNLPYVSCYYGFSESIGILDPDFGDDGLVISRIDGTNTYASDIARQSNGKIIVGVTTDCCMWSRDLTLLRYNPDGSLDTSFGVGGMAAADIGNHNEDTLRSIVVQPDGKIIAAGDTYTESWDSDFALVRFNPDGSLDSSFGNGGIVTTTINIRPGDLYPIVALQADGKIVAAGDTQDSYVHSDFVLVRYNPDGSLDTSFDGDGIVVSDFTQYDHLRDLAVQPDGKIVVVGYTGTDNHDFRITLVRYNPDSSLDSSFGGDGLVNLYFNEADNEYGYALTLLPDGKIVIAGSVTEVENRFVLARVNPDGSVDRTKTLFFGGDFDSANAVAVERTGKIIALGSSDNKFALARLNPDFSLDTSFSDDGMLTTSIGDEAGGTALALLIDGKILAAGTINVI